MTELRQIKSHYHIIVEIINIVEIMVKNNQPGIFVENGIFGKNNPMDHNLVWSEREQFFSSFQNKFTVIHC